MNLTESAMLDLRELRSDFYEANSAIMRVGSVNEDAPNRAHEREQEANARYDRLTRFITAQAAVVEAARSFADSAMGVVQVSEREQRLIAALAALDAMEATDE